MPNPAALLAEVEALIDTVIVDQQRHMARWSHWDIQPDFRVSAENLAAYLALRHHDLRRLQRGLMELGLSSLGRLESRVLPSLMAVRAALAAMCGTAPPPEGGKTGFFDGEARLERRSRHLFGAQHKQRPVALLVTCPTAAADDPAFLRQLMDRGVEAIRINCAHDGPAQWQRMIEHVRTAEAETGRRIRVFMDLAGPKIRTGDVLRHLDAKRLFPGDRIAVVAPGELRRKVPPDVAFSVECTLPEAIIATSPGQRLLIDDGTISGRIDTVEEGMLIASITCCKEKGAKLKPEKGINLPDTELHVPALTAKDIADLSFVAAHADGVEFSFVQEAGDIVLLQEGLARLRPDDWHKLALILKIETARAVHNLPELVVQAGARQPVAIMIARGDLAIEIGFARLAEMQEEILWIAEAAQVPVIWATQVLEHLVKEGMPNRGELTDAAMGARAECIMLNKGPYLLDAIDTLHQLLVRMDDHLHKKTPQLRRLASW